jgi:hypothetical protein
VTEQSKPTEKTTRQRTSRAPARPDQIAFTIAQVQEVGGPGRTKVYELVAEGKLKMVHVGGRSRITGASLRLLLGASEQDVFIGQRTHEADALQSSVRPSTSEKQVKAATPAVGAR